MSVVWEAESGAAPRVGTKRQLRVWDGATRLAHWLMAALVGASWWTASRHHMTYHRYSGYALLAVLAFRLYWGFFGSTTARFAHFVKGPRSIWRYLCSRTAYVGVGHNPLGALSTLTLLSLLAGQVALGLFCVDVDGLESGPLSHWITFEAGRECARLHRLGFAVLKWGIVLHVAAVIFYLIVGRNNLIRPMLTGSRAWSHDSVPHLEFVSVWRALLGAALASLLVWSVI